MRSLNSVLEVDYCDPGNPFRCLVDELPFFLEKIAHVSQHFHASAFSAVKLFLERNTFPVVPEDLPQLSFIASLFKAAIPSVFLYIEDCFKIEDLLDYTNIISGLKAPLVCQSDLQFLDQSSPLFFPHLKQLDVNADSAIFIELVNALKFNSTITVLDLEFGSLCADCVTSLSDALRVNSSIKTITLVGISMGDDYSIALADSLKVNSTITDINLEFNSIGSEGVVILSEALRVNSTIKAINLGGNSVDAIGAKALADALRVNRSITRVSLGCNSIGDEGVLALANVLEDNSSISEISLVYISLSYQV
ncbi:hypothetical protein GEMRC1_004765 [Eukaryota sp. GEM-RC1]